MTTNQQSDLDEIVNLDIQEGELHSAKCNLLRKHGWSLASDNPACLWLWLKTINGVRYAVNESTALDFVRAELS